MVEYQEIEKSLEKMKKKERVEQKKQMKQSPVARRQQLQIHRSPTNRIYKSNIDRNKVSSPKQHNYQKAHHFQIVGPLNVYKKITTTCISPSAVNIATR